MTADITTDRILGSERVSRLGVGMTVVREIDTNKARARGKRRKRVWHQREHRTEVDRRHSVGRVTAESPAYSTLDWFWAAVRRENRVPEQRTTFIGGTDNVQ